MRRRGYSQDAGVLVVLVGQLRTNKQTSLKFWWKFKIDILFLCKEGCQKSISLLSWSPVLSQLHIWYIHRLYHVYIVVHFHSRCIWNGGYCFPGLNVKYYRQIQVAYIIMFFRHLVGEMRNFVVRVAFFFQNQSDNFNICIRWLVWFLPKINRFRKENWILLWNGCGDLSVRLGSRISPHRHRVAVEVHWRGAQGWRSISWVVATFNHVGGSFNLSMAAAGDVWIIPSFRIWGYVLHDEHISCVITDSIVANFSEPSLLFSQ